jgi:NAD(P)-dependent dehydrogenase (short-subunit alcohol dehydrogenase family)
MNGDGSRKSRRILVFGGARGIGEAVARNFIRAGDSVAIVARTASEVSEAAVSMSADGFVGDITNPDAVERIMDATGAADVVVNAAAIQGGRGAIGPLWETDPMAFAKVVNINLVGAYIVLRAALRRMRPRRAGTVVMFSGGGSTAPRPNFDAYGASKTAVLRLVESAQWALDNEGSAVRVFAIAPGLVSTAMTREVIENADVVPNEAEAARRAAAGQSGVPPTLAAELCLFLASPQGAPLSGRLVHVKENYRDYVRSDLGPDAGRLRRVDYPHGQAIRQQPAE